MTCPNCQAPITPGLVFCPRCGVELRAARSAEWSDSSPSLPVVAVRAASPLASAPSAVSPGATPPFAALSPAVVAPPAAPAQPASAAAPGLDGAPLYLVPPPLFLRLFGPRAESPTAIPAEPPGHAPAASDDAAVPPAPPAPAAPLSPARALLRRVLPRRYATNLWTMAALGALVAIGLGLALSIPLSHAADGAAVASLLQSGVWQYSAIGETANIVAYIVSGDPIAYFLIANRLPFQVTITITGPIGAQQSSPVYALTLPVLGSLLLPALALVVGGAISASSRAGRVPRYAITRGALIGPFYGLALAALAAIATNRAIPVGPDGAQYAVTASAGWALLYGTLWGVLFGALGGWIAVSGRAWLSAALATWRDARSRSPRVAGALAGALAAFLAGLALAGALALGAAGFIALAAPYAALDLANPFGLPVGIAPIQPLGAPRLLLLGVALGVLFGLPLAVWLFTLAAGAPVDAFQHTFLASTSNATHSSLGFVGAQMSLPHALWPPLALVPVVAYLFGGRVASRVAGAVRREETALVGAAMALPLAILLALAALVVSVGFTTSDGANAAGAAPSPAGTFLAVLLGGAVVGALGGLSTRVRLTRMPLVPVLLTPLWLLGRILAWPLDRLAGRADAEPPSLARRWLYAGVVAALLGLALTGIAAQQTLAAGAAGFERMQLTDAVLGGLLLAVPALCWGCSLLAALFAPAASAPLPAFDPPLAPDLYVAVPVEALAELAFAPLPDAHGGAPTTPRTSRHPLHSQEHDDA